MKSCQVSANRWPPKFLPVKLACETKNLTQQFGDEDGKSIVDHSNNSGHKADYGFLHTRPSPIPACDAGSDSKDGKVFPAIAIYYFSLHIHWNSGINSTGDFRVGNLADTSDGKYPVHHAAILNFLPY
jgi:hypothetical protein